MSILARKLLRAGLTGRRVLATTATGALALALALTACGDGDTNNGETKRRACTSTEDAAGRRLDLVVTLGEGEVPPVVLSVYQDDILGESVEIRQASPDDSESQIVIQKDGDVVFERGFVFNPQDVSLPLNLHLEDLLTGTVADPGLQVIADLARNMPRLELLSEFADVLPNRVALSEDGRSFSFGYRDRPTMHGEVLVDPSKVCTQPEAERQHDLRLQRCDLAWHRYQELTPVSDYDCLFCSIVGIDPCTGLPFGAQGVLLPGVIVFVVIMLWSSSAE